MSNWPRGRSADGGIDEIPLPGRGRLWLCGKHVVGPDPEAAIARVGAGAVLCLNQRHEVEDRYPDYLTWLQTAAEGRHWFPTPDLGVRPTGEFLAMVEERSTALAQGEALIAHCGAGIGRAGTFAVAVLLALGRPLDEAVATVADHRPMAGPEAGSQRRLIEEAAGHFSSQPG